MAAGQGYIEFATGDVLTAAAANGYLASQVVMVFASSSARTSAIASPQEGMLSYLKDTNAVEAYDGSAWISIGSTGDITGVTAGTGISGGGTSGTVTVTNSMATAIDAKGDLIAGTAADTFSRLAVGADNTVLTADSTTATGLKWASTSSGSFAGVLCTKGATQTISNTTDTVLNFSGTDTYDTDGFHDPSTNNSRITIPAGLGGYYMIYGLNTWDVNATGRRFCELKKNGTKIYTSNGFSPNSTAAPSNMISVVLNLSAGDYLEYQVWQSSGGNLDTFGDAVLCWFGAAKL